MADPDPIEKFYDTPLPARLRRLSYAGGPAQLRRAEALARSRGFDRLARGLCAGLAAARRSGLNAARRREDRDRLWLWAYRQAGLDSLPR